MRASDMPEVYAASSMMELTGLHLGSEEQAHWPQVRGSAGRACQAVTGQHSTAALTRMPCCGWDSWREVLGEGVALQTL